MSWPYLLVKFKVKRQAQKTLQRFEASVLGQLLQEGGAKPVQKVGEGESKPPPYGPGGNPQDPSRGPPPPYPGQPKVRKQAWF